MRKLANVTIYHFSKRENTLEPLITKVPESDKLNHSFHTYLVNIYCVPGSVLGDEYMGEQDKEDPSALMQFPLVSWK